MIINVAPYIQVASGQGRGILLQMTARLSLLSLFAGDRYE